MPADSHVRASNQGNAILSSIEKTINRVNQKEASGRRGINDAGGTPDGNS